MRYVNLQSKCVEIVRYITSGSELLEGPARLSVVFTEKSR